ncbi:MULTISPECIES: hypothetical protein [Halococcus]|uniref:Uncharacterized protein n=1 Tax=Halococcus saccharolyticus DSM 5350 TaxID=1227455 RepID=M0MFW7_9EURY|nr:MULTISPECIES: hypothetical protein [Halococcus]EMA43569.1 hypothetical protein C449_13457 [Halococcus saccharolyticus DSM 5350]
MSGEVEAVIGGPGVSEITDEQLQPVEEWIHSEHDHQHEYSLIFGGNGPWVLCLSCEWSEDLPDRLYQ